MRGEHGLSASESSVLRTLQRKIGDVIKYDFSTYCGDQIKEDKRMGEAARTEI
jgi:hypothetical protein